MKARQIVAGIDVGGHRKGFHGVALDDGVYFQQLHTTDPECMARWCREMGARLIGIDAPCRWSEDGRARPAEQQLVARGIRCFASPTREKAIVHPKNYYGWMLNGEALYQAVEVSHPLLAGLPLGEDQSCCFETFPHAICCALAGQVMTGRNKLTVRRTLLAQMGLSVAELTNIDWLDATLCAVAAAYLASGMPCTVYGEPNTGLIIVPEGVA